MIYYAHSVTKYGTDIEKFELALIGARFPLFQIINPNGMNDESLPEDEILRNCFSIISRGDCEGLVFSSMSGLVGIGVLNEIQCAMGQSIPVYEISGAEIYKVQSIRSVEVDFSNRVFAQVFTVRIPVR